MKDQSNVVNLVENGDFVLETKDTVVWLDAYPCEVSYIPGVESFVQYNSIIFQKNWEFYNLFSFFIRKMRQAGIFQKLGNNVKNTLSFIESNSSNSLFIAFNGFG